MQILDNLMIIFGLKIYEFEIYNKNQKQKKLLEKKLNDKKILENSTILNVLKTFWVLNSDLDIIKQNIIDYGFVIVETKKFETMVKENEQNLSFFAMICSLLFSPWSFWWIGRFFMFITIQAFILLWAFQKIWPGWGVFFMFINYFFLFIVPKLLRRYLFNIILAKDMKDYRSGSFVIIP